MSAVPDGYAPLALPGEFIGVNGPLYLRHTNPLGICHGGMMASFCDMLLPITIHRKSDVGLRFVPTISLQLDYLAPAPEGAWVEGEGEVLRVTRSMVFAQGLATADGTPVARVSGVFKIGPAIPGLGG